MENEKLVGKLSAYCEEKKITIYRLAKMTGVSRVRLYSIDKNSSMPINSLTIEKILNGTKKEFGEALHPSKYLDYSWLKR